jgi:nucleoside-diphosphate-sugar epimerase
LAPLNFLVTGINGFIGSNLAKKLIAQEHQVRGLILEGTDESNLEGIAEQIEKVYGDITVPETIQSFFNGIDIVVHLAARASDWGAEKLFRKINFGGSKNVLQAAITAGVKRFLFMSSLVVHGFDGFQNADEQTPYNPWNAYARSKKDVEDLLNDTLAQGTIEVVIMRPGFNIFGPHDRLGSLELFSRIERGKSLPCLSKGKSLICYSYVENLVDGIILVATHPDAKGTYIITDGPIITNKVMYEKMFEACEREPKISSIPSWLGTVGAAIIEAFSKLVRKKERPLITRYLVKVGSTDLGFSNGKIVKELGYNASVDIVEAYKRTYEWYKRESEKLQNK